MTNETILYLSDQTANSNSMLAALKASGYEVVGTNSAPQATALLYILHTVAGVVLNLRASERNTSVARSLQAIRPDVPIVLLCGDRIDACHHTWMLAWIPDSRSKGSPLRCDVC